VPAQCVVTRSSSLDASAILRDDGVFLLEDEAGETVVTEAGASVVLKYERKPTVVKKPPLAV